MLTADESAELRILQAQAYRQDDDLSAEQITRLRELERRRDAEVSAGEADARPVDDSSTLSGLEVVRDVSGDFPVAPSPRIRTWLAALAVIVVFALGIGFGWMLFGRADISSIGLTQEQRLRGEELVADGNYDANSLRAMLAHDGVIVWLATTDAGETLCLMVDDGLDATSACSDEDRVASDGLAVVHQTDGDGYTDEAYATLLLTAEREPAVHLDVHRSTDE
ncbi:hypothetical protein [Microbacterium sp. A93]|uniref:hypothetical protein n=1 Tax=Microbacterium sp. A93 TaxID=3450716 RepID=UPI003F42E4ED